MIAPDNRYKRWWNVFVAVVTTYEAIATPARIAFGYTGVFWLNLVDLITFGIFAADIYLTFRTATVVRGRPVNDPKLVAKDYLHSWFTVDLLGTIPFHYFLLPFGLAATWQWVEWFRLLRLVRLWRFTSYLNHQQSQHFLIRRLVIFLFWIGLIIHLTACGWIMVGQGSDTTMTSYPNQLTRYLRSLYWTITTVSTTGYGDIVPKTNLQTVYATLTMLLGAGMYATFVANIASILTRVDGARAAYQQKLERLNTFMRYKRLPGQLQKKILGYHAYLWETGLGYDESSMTNELPSSLREAVTLFLSKDIIKHVPFFAKANEAVLHNIVGDMESVVLTPGDYLFRAGDIGRSMYFITHGSVEVVSADGQLVYATLREGDFLGEIALLNSTARTASVRAVNYCNLYALHREKFDLVMREFPDFAAQVRETAEARKRAES